MTALATLAPPRRGLLQGLSNLLYSRRGLLLLLLLLPPVLWLGVIYIASLLVFLAHAFFSVDEFSGVLQYDLTLDTLGQLFQAANFDVILRTVIMAAAVTVFAALLAFPIAYYMARYAAGRTKAFLYLLVMMPLWSSYLVRVYAWKLILAKEGVIGWFAEATGTDGLLNWILSTPLLGGPSLSQSYYGIFIVFLYIWMPFMILPIQAALERVPRSLLDASSDLGARPGATFRKVILPLALPGVAAGSIFTFSLTLGDYIVPYIFGQSKFFIGQVVYLQQGTAGNIPLAAAFTLVPIVIMGFYLWLAKKAGAFDAL